MSNLKSQIESILFVAGKPLKANSIAKILEVEIQTVKEALQEIAKDRSETGIVLLDTGDEYQLATNSANSPQVKNFLNSELREKLTDATVETLAIIAYRQPISKAEIEAIRGVNSQYSVRALLMRGLVEKVPNPHDARASHYQITSEFLQHLGITSIKDLPDFEALVKEIKLPEAVQIKDEAPQTEGEAVQEIPASNDTLAETPAPEIPAPKPLEIETPQPETSSPQPLD